MPQIGDAWHSDDETLAALIERFDQMEMGRMADALRHVRRAYRIRTSDLVGNENMIGARVTYVDGEGEPHRGIVLEPEVSDIGGECWDPNKGETVDASEYPMGTVQLIRGDGWEFGSEDGFFDRLESDHPGRGIRAETSVTPATSPDDTYCYFAGWEYADRDLDQ